MTTKEELDALFEETLEADKEFDNTATYLAKKYNISDEDLKKLEDARTYSDAVNYDYFYKLGENSKLHRTFWSRIRRLFK